MNPIVDKELLLTEKEKNRLRMKFGETPTLEHVKWDEAIRSIEPYYKHTITVLKQHRFIPSKVILSGHRFIPRGKNDMAICTSDDFEIAFNMAKSQIKNKILND